MYDTNAIFSSYSMASSYWLIFEGAPADPMLEIGAEPAYHQPNLMAVFSEKGWVAMWKKATGSLIGTPLAQTMRATVIPAEVLPSLQEIQLSLKPLSELQAIAEHIWIAHYLSEGRLTSHMQPVVRRDGGIAGYEAFARLSGADSASISGGDIMRASRVLRLEYQVDRLMHQQAIQTYMEHGLEGLLFINFLTHFIHLPKTYLSGLHEAIERYHMPPQSIVLDVPLGHYGSNVAKLTAIAEYCRKEKIQLAFDDVTSAATLPDLLAQMRPAYIKLDSALTASIHTKETQRIVRDIMHYAHGFNVRIIAESVETQAQKDAYQALDIDLFQGYLFGAPSAVPLKNQM